MADEKTRADAIREFLTGASSDDGAQIDPDASLGNFKSSTQADSMDRVVANPISGITIEYASGSNQIGAGQLDADTADTVRWRSNAQTYGTSVTILNGETKIIEENGNPGAFVRISRTSASALAGTATLTLARAANNVYALDDVTSAEALAGDSEYRAIMAKNVSASPVSAFKLYMGTLGTVATTDTTQLGASGAGTIATTGSFADWPSSGWATIRSSTDVVRETVYYSSRTDSSLTVPAAGRARLDTSAGAGAAGDTVDAVPGIAIAKDTAGVQAGGSSIQTIADEDTAPTSVTWETGLTAASGVDVGTMTAGQQVGIWIWRDIPAAAVSIAENVAKIHKTFDAV